MASLNSQRQSIKETVQSVSILCVVDDDKIDNDADVDANDDEKDDNNNPANSNKAISSAFRSVCAYCAYCA